LYYHGQLDDSRPGNDIPLSGEDLRSAVRDLNQDNSYPSNQMPSLGCNIKWTPGKNRVGLNELKCFFTHRNMV